MARILLVHEYRRIILRDPILPAELAARGLARSGGAGAVRPADHRLLPASERWLDDNGQNEGRKLPPPGPELRARFRPAALASS